MPFISVFSLQFLHFIQACSRQLIKVAMNEEVNGSPVSASPIFHSLSSHLINDCSQKTTLEGSVGGGGSFDNKAGGGGYFLNWSVSTGYYSRACRGLHSIDNVQTAGQEICWCGNMKALMEARKAQQTGKMSKTELAARSLAKLNFH